MSIHGGLAPVPMPMNSGYFMRIAVAHELMTASVRDVAASKSQQICHTKWIISVMVTMFCVLSSDPCDSLVQI